MAAALAAARVGTWSWDIVADHLVWDVSLRRVVGLTDDEPLPAGKDFAEWIHVDERELTSTAIGYALARRRPYEVEFRLRHIDGSWHWHHSRGTVTFVDNEPVAMLGACVDVTDLRQAQDAISAAESADSCAISIRDNGIGIAPEHHGRIFYLFYYLHPRDQFEGSGIGLAIC